MLNQLRNVTRKLESDLQSGKKRHSELVEQCQALKKGREDSDERENALDELKKIEQKYNELKDEMGKYADNDPATFDKMKLYSDSSTLLTNSERRALLISELFSLVSLLVI